MEPIIPSDQPDVAAALRRWAGFGSSPSATAIRPRRWPRSASSTGE